MAELTPQEMLAAAINRATKWRQRCGHAEHAERQLRLELSKTRQQLATLQERCRAHGLPA